MRDKVSRKRRGRRDYFVCPQCGEEVKVGARACPHCGSDEETGWSQEAENRRTDIPAGYGRDEEFDYDKFVEREFPERAGRARASSSALLVAIAVAMLALLVLLLLSRR